MLPIFSHVISYLMLILGKFWNISCTWYDIVLHVLLVCKMLPVKASRARLDIRASFKCEIKKPIDLWLLVLTLILFWLFIVTFPTEHHGFFLFSFFMSSFFFICHLLFFWLWFISLFLLPMLSLDNVAATSQSAQLEDTFVDAPQETVATPESAFVPTTMLCSEAGS